MHDTLFFWQSWKYVSPNEMYCYLFCQMNDYARYSLKQYICGSQPLQKAVNPFNNTI